MYINAYQQGKILKLLYIDFQMLESQHSSLPQFSSQSRFLISQCNQTTYFLQHISLLLHIYYIKSQFQQANFIHKITSTQSGSSIQKSYVKGMFTLFSTQQFSLQSKQYRFLIIYIMMLEILFLHFKWYSNSYYEMILTFQMIIGIRVNLMQLQHFQIIFCLMKRNPYSQSYIIQVNTFLLFVVLQMATIQRLPSNQRRMRSFQNGQIEPFTSIISSGVDKMRCQFRGQLMMAQRDFESFKEMFGHQSDIYQEQFKNQMFLKQFKLG
ncbi:unnamed protein product (macronuclear) [Paramecium tetraurelia]|uniref:Transmembrane protein n=1 Tax=Paramecium tetraurelia TaxID=5888 RepID=A0EID0_PARTE|nr:uncharacterized protein GSPATT00027400001 [Paramecium tetraurelia]CAK95071.1 unnamed protein product [Paramecium tetraurelia]|eukprot:XP_001462444.1 hypothetical protein (macronuclear) [Paramecium tetraurelia strain d4-2]